MSYISMLIFATSLLLMSLVWVVAWRRRRRRRQELILRKMLAWLIRLRRNCVATHANRDKFSWGPDEIRSVLSRLRSKALATRAQLELFRAPVNSLEGEAGPAIEEASRAMARLADRLAEYSADLSADKIDAVRYGLDPFSGHLSDAEVRVSQCISRLRACLRGQSVRQAPIRRQSA